MIPDTVTPQATNEEILYEEFKQTNWWSRNTLLPVLIAALWGVGWVVFLLKLEVESFSTSQARGLLGMFAFSILVLMLGLVTLKHFSHDRPWEKCRKWLEEKDGWSTDVGGILKIYD
jgi:hypothetical protein